MRNGSQRKFFPQGLLSFNWSLGVSDQRLSPFSAYSQDSQEQFLPSDVLLWEKRRIITGNIYNDYNTFLQWNLGKLSFGLSVSESEILSYTQSILIVLPIQNVLFTCPVLLFLYLPQNRKILKNPSISSSSTCTAMKKWISQFACLTRALHPVWFNCHYQQLPPVQEELLGCWGTPKDHKPIHAHSTWGTLTLS